MDPLLAMVARFLHTLCGDGRAYTQQALGARLGLSQRTVGNLMTPSPGRSASARTLQHVGEHLEAELVRYLLAHPTDRPHAELLIHFARSAKHRPRAPAPRENQPRTVPRRRGGAVR